MRNYAHHYSDTQHHSYRCRYEAIGLPVVNGWGLTETSPVLACRRLVNNARGTVGLPVPGTEIRVVDAMAAMSALSSLASNSMSMDDSADAYRQATAPNLMPALVDALAAAPDAPQGTSGRLLVWCCG
jgi:long-subunit acyl-CoA synthetase (AMP-forming)